MNDNIDYRHVIANAAAYKLTGQNRIYLHGATEKPWHLATEVEPGGSHRLEIATSVRFSGKHQPSGIEFHWSFDIEPFEANGKGHYEIDRDGVREVLRNLPVAGRAKFLSYLNECAERIKTKAREYQAIADRQFADAAVLAELAGRP